MDEIPKRIERTRELLRTVKHATMATVNEDGSPHNTPFLFLHDDKLTKVYWGSHPESQHSQNIQRTGQLFVVAYDAFQGGGLYLRAENGQPLEGAELDEALKVHNAFRAKTGKPPLERTFYTGNSPQRMWSANITNYWINSVERDKNGAITKDFRHEVTADELTG